MSRYTIFVIALLLSHFTASVSQAELRVVATLSTFADLASRIGGEHVAIETIVPAKFNPHFIDPRPSDVLKVKRADVFVHAGLDLEIWKFALLNAAGNSAVEPGGEGEIDLSRGIPLLEVPARKQTRAEGDIHLFGNPHYWLNPHNGLIMARTIAQRFSEVDPDHQADYQENLARFETDLKGAMETWQTTLSSLRSHEVIAYHNQWPYLLDFCGVEATHFVEPKPGIPPGPRYLKTLANYIEQGHIRAIIWSSLYSGRSSKSLSKMSGATVVQLAQGVGEVHEASDYISLIQYNVMQLTAVLGR